MLLAHAALGCHSVLSRSMALRFVIIFRITATMTTLDFLCGGKTIVERFDGWVVSAAAEGCHVEDVADRHSTSIDAAMSPELSAVEVVGRKSDECCDLLAAHLPELWEQSDECKCQHGTNARHRDQQ